MRAYMTPLQETYVFPLRLREQNVVGYPTLVDHIMVVIAVNLGLNGKRI